MRMETPEVLTAAPIIASQNGLAKKLQLSSSACAVAGGVILASNTNISGYGFIFLALSSSQLLASSVLTKNQSLMVYAGSLFVFVDCLGMFRWLVK
jgi:hypothetical protein